MLSFALTLRATSGVFGPFLASIADKRGRKTGMSIGILLAIAGTGLMVGWNSYAIFVTMLVLTMIGNLVFVPSMQAYFGDRIPYQRRGAVIAATELSWSLSFIIGVPAVTWLIAQYGWQSPFLILAGLLVLALIVLSALLPKGNHRHLQTKNLRQNFSKIFRFRPALGGILVAITISASNELVNLIFGVWIEDTYQVAIASLAVAALIIGISELGGELLVTFTSDSLGKRRAVGIGLALNCVSVVLLLLSGRSLTGALVGLFLLYITFEFALVSSIPLMTEVLPSTRATFMAVYIAAMSLGRALGAALSPILYEFGKSLTSLPSILIIVLVSISLNLCALVALQLVKPASSPQVDTPKDGN
jgi:predicted MFS family arabinose efflux permease